MYDVRLQQSLARQLRRERPTVADGMKAVQAALEKSFPSLNWKSCRDINWQAGLDRWVAWMDNLVAVAPPPPLGLIWFETPSELNPALTSVSGWATVGSAEDAYGADEDRIWPEDDSGTTLDAGLLNLPEVEEAWRRGGWREENPNAGDEQRERIRSGVSAIAGSYVLLLVLSGLPRTRLAAGLPPAKSLGVAMGWADGDIEPIGGYSAKGWKGFPRVRAADKGVPQEFTYSDSGRDYVKRGGDIHYRDPKTGQSVLHFACHSDFADIKALVDAGADVNAVDARGESVLHAFGAADLTIIKYLLARGAIPRDPPSGESLLDRVTWDGRCTAKHLKLFVSLGLKLRQVHPLVDIAESGLHYPARERNLRDMLRFWLARGFNINTPDDQGRTPLWLSLERHARELLEHNKWLAKNGPTLGTWDLQRDSVARLLLEAGADPNARWTAKPHRLIPKNATPLMLRRYDDDTLVAALLKHGADPHATCASGKTALHYAQLAAKSPDTLGHQGAAKVVALLERAMRKPTGTAPPTRTSPPPTASGTPTKPSRATAKPKTQRKRDSR